MKLLFFACILPFSFFNSFAQLTGGDFENWSDTILYDTPMDWRSSNQEMYNIINTVFKSTDTQEGLYSVKLGGAEQYNDTIAGYVLHGDIATTTGVPYTDNFEAVLVNYKIDLQANDSLYLVLVRKNNGSIVDYQIKPFAFGPATTWTPQIIPIGNTPQDELMIGFIIGDPNTSHRISPISWALIDNIKLISGGLYTTDLPNYNFEEWENKTIEIPDEWETMSPMLTRYNIDNVVKSLDPFEANFAIELSTVLLGTDTIAGILSKGIIDFESGGNPFGAIPIASTPVSVAGAYKFVATSVDEGLLQIQFFDNGTLVGYHEENFTPNSNYTIFNSNIGMFGVPDSMILIVFSGDNPGSVLTLDALDFD